MTFMTIEYAARHACPSIEEKALPYGLLRYAHGFTRRANSLSVFDNTVVDGVELVQQCEDFFSDRQQPAIVRIPSFSALSSLDRFLKECGYLVATPSQVMTCVLDKSCRSSVNPIRLDAENWLDNYYQISNEDLSKRSVHSELIKRIKGIPIFVCLENEEGDPVCCAIAVLFNNVVGIYSVVTDPAFKRRQFATQLLSALLAWGRNQRATHAFLLVEECNVAAIALYQKLGFKTFYNYWYREKAV